MQGPEAQNIAHRHQKYDQAFFFFSILNVGLLKMQ